ncbi:GNAT family N-acetyltransferase [Thalassomonas haliotis]|uniref:GNAT family N-acetyltransferase n=1 Tax=Thalassomonas haliotis TaxID=485448 RepID=A0ABY7V9F7_9GAMM|nr:GNAT family N-acetyltransferase [Thalassomonas haliotis]WDE09982.1 GNAT family N-acetyltransferase [Thalassomonas haliotis]
MRFEAATAKHKTFFWELYIDAMRAHIEKIWGWDLKWQENDFETRWLSCVNNLLVLDETPVGYIQTQALPDNQYIMMLIIAPEYRGKGVGKAALGRLRANCIKPYLRLRVFESNEKALKFYIRYGYELIEKEESFYVLQQAVAGIGVKRQE